MKVDCGGVAAAHDHADALRRLRPVCAGEERSAGGGPAGFSCDAELIPEHRLRVADGFVGHEPPNRVGVATLGGGVLPLGDGELRARAADIAKQIAARRPEAVQGTVRAIWEALDMTRSAALQNGLAYTHIGNPSPDARTPRAPNGKPTFR